MNLFIGTATNKIYLMLFDEQKMIKQIIKEGKNDHTVKLYDLIDELEIDLQEITGVYPITGPGSYTGLRVGVTFAKTLAMANNIKMYPVNMMDALYYSNDKLVVGLDARGKKHYVYDGNKISLEKTSDLTDVLIDPSINLEKLFASQYLTTIEPVNYLELQIEYIKNAI